MILKLLVPLQPLSIMNINNDLTFQCVSLTCTKYAEAAYSLNKHLVCCYYFPHFVVCFYCQVCGLVHVFIVLPIEIKDDDDVLFALF